jgi:hypothetical protein
MYYGRGYDRDYGSGRISYEVIVMRIIRERLLAQRRTKERKTVKLLVGFSPEGRRTA